MGSSARARLALVFGGAVLAACGGTGDPAPHPATATQTVEPLPDPVPEVIEVAAAVPGPLSLDASLAALAREDYVAARQGFLALARSGNAEAQFRLAMMLGYGMGGPRSDTYAKGWLAKAADQGHVEAQTMWSGMVFWSDEAATEDELSTALEWVRRAATQGDQNAMATLALLYANDNRFRDPAEAARWNDQLDILDAIAEARARNNTEIAKIEQRLGEIDQELQVIDAAAALPRGPEPSEADMRSAFEYAMHGGGDPGAAQMNNGIANGALSIKQFQKDRCEPANDADGYWCWYVIEAGLTMQANDGGGVQWNGILDALLVPERGSGRFAYDTARQHWVRFEQ